MVDKNIDSTTRSGDNGKHANTDMPIFTHLILSGGGLMGIVYIGILRYIYQEKLDVHIKHVAGTSMGAYFAVMFVMGVTITSIEDDFKNVPRDMISFDITSILDLHSTLGISNGDFLVTHLKKYIGKMTFLDMTKKTGKNLVICATHAVSMTPTYFSVDTTPNVCVIDAVKASMAVPLLVAPIKIGEDYYLDGGITHNSPLQLFPSNVPKNNILIIVLYSGDSKNKKVVDFDKFNSYVSDTDCDNSFQKIQFFISYIGAIINTLNYNKQFQYLLRSVYPYSIEIFDIGVERIRLHMQDNTFYIKLPDVTEIDGCISQGYSVMHDVVTRRR